MRHIAAHRNLCVGETRSAIDTSTTHAPPVTSLTFLNKYHTSSIVVPGMPYDNILSLIQVQPAQQGASCKGRFGNFAFNTLSTQFPHSWDTGHVFDPWRRGIISDINSEPSLLSHRTSGMSYWNKHCEELEVDCVKHNAAVQVLA
jgi:hypothetical protein